MELGQSETVGILYDKRVGIGNVNTRLNDRGADQNIGLARQHSSPDLLQLFPFHAPVSHGYTRIGNSSGKACRHHVDIVDIIIQIEDLTAAAKLATYSFLNDQVVVLKHVGLNGQSVARRLVENRNVAQTAHCHVQRSGNRSGAESQHVNVSAKLLELFLLRNTKPLLLVNDKQTKVLELNIF